MKLCESIEPIVIANPCETPAHYGTRGRKKVQHEVFQGMVRVRGCLYPWHYWSFCTGPVNEFIPWLSLEVRREGQTDFRVACSRSWPGGRPRRFAHCGLRRI